MQNQATTTATQPRIPVGFKNGAIAFTKVALPYGWLGNMSPEPLLYEGKRYRTAEALFQCLRFEGHPEIQKAIRDCPSPMSAKMVAKKHKPQIQNRVPERGPDDIARMRLCLRLKVEQHPAIRRMLLATGDHVLIEDVQSRRSSSGTFWGAYWDADQAAWVGDNMLGKCWMELRSSLRAQAPQAA